MEDRRAATSGYPGVMSAFAVEKYLAPFGRTVLETAAETLWPTRCAVCDQPGHLLCRPCEQSLALIDACRACPRCGAPWGSVQCTECNTVALAPFGRNEPPFDAMASAVVLDSAARRIVTTYKDRGEQRLAPVIAQYMARYFSPSWTSGGEAALTFIPATANAKRRRGFDHVELITRKLSQTTGTTARPLLLHPKSIDQRTLGRRGRLANMQRKITIDPQAEIPRAVIVIDDVCTTGATLYAAADALRTAGAERIWALTFARA